MLLDHRPCAEHVEESRRDSILHGAERRSRAGDVQFPPVHRSEQLYRSEALLTGQPRALVRQRNFYDPLRTGIVAPPQEHDAVGIGAGSGLIRTACAMLKIAVTAPITARINTTIADQPAAAAHVPEGRPEICRECDGSTSTRTMAGLGGVRAPCLQESTYLRSPADRFSFLQPIKQTLFAVSDLTRYYNVDITSH
jgi:hypothetical protein